MCNFGPSVSSLLFHQHQKSRKSETKNHPTAILLRPAREYQPDDVGLRRATSTAKSPPPQKRAGTVAALAQLRSETPLCLLRAELSSITGAENHIDIGRTPRSYANASCASRLDDSSVAVDIATLFKGRNSAESSVSPPLHYQATPQPSSIRASGPRPRAVARAVSSSTTTSHMNNGRRGMPPHASDQPVKKQSKWSPEEDALIIELRGSGMKWEDISKRLPGRSAISCRLHYQNYLERRSEWDEERKNKLARLYERFKPEMWAKVAEEMAVPWRAAEAMHWQLGEGDMARRAGVIPFSLAAVNVDTNNNGHRNSPSRNHTHSQSQSGMPHDLRDPSPRTVYSRMQHMTSVPAGRNMAPRRESIPVPAPLPMGSSSGAEVHYVPGPGLAPIQNQQPPRGAGMLPGVAELTTGVSPYTTPVGTPGAGPIVGGTQGPPFPSLASYSMALESASGSKRRASSPDPFLRDANHRRRLV